MSLTTEDIQTQSNIKLSEKVEAFLKEIEAHPKYKEGGEAMEKEHSKYRDRSVYRRRVDKGPNWIHQFLMYEPENIHTKEYQNSSTDDLEDDDRPKIFQERFLLTNLKKVEGSIFLFPKYKNQNRIEFSFVGITKSGTAVSYSCCATDEGFMFCTAANNEKIFPNLEEFLKFILPNKLQVSNDDPMNAQNKKGTTAGNILLTAGGFRKPSATAIESTEKSAGTATAGSALSGDDYAGDRKRTVESNMTLDSRTSGFTPSYNSRSNEMSIASFEGVDLKTRKAPDSKTQDGNKSECIIC